MYFILVKLGIIFYLITVKDEKIVFYNNFIMLHDQLLLFYKSILLKNQM